MKIVIAPNAYKGTITAATVAEAIAQGVQISLPDAETVIAPVADGGDGTLETLLGIFHGIRRSSVVCGPIGDAVEADWGIIHQGNTAVIEAAHAFGFALMPKDRMEPGITTSRGVGNLIVSALDLGIRDFVLAIGGSANNDGGSGMMRALGMQFFDHDGNDLEEGGLALQRLVTIDDSGLDPRLADSTFQVLSDSTVPLTGTSGVSLMYSPGKGASPEIAVALDDALTWYSKIIKEQFEKDMSQMSSAGSGGGVVGAIEVFLDAKPSLGIEVILKEMNFDDILHNTDLVITGEGQIDEQTIYDKAPCGVAKKAKEFQLPVLTINARVGNGWRAVLEHGIDAVIAVVSDNETAVNEQMLREKTAAAIASANASGALASADDLKRWGLQDHHAKS